MSFIGGSPQPALSYGQIYQLALNSGFTGQAAVTATAIAQAESSGIPNNYNPADAHGGSVGLMQINGANAPLIGGSTWLNTGSDPQASMNAAFSLYSARGNFTDWGTYTNGSYSNYLSGANAAAASGGQPLSPGIDNSTDSGALFDNSTPGQQLTTNADFGEDFGAATNSGALGAPAVGLSPAQPQGLGFPALGVGADGTSSDPFGNMSVGPASAADQAAANANQPTNPTTGLVSGGSNVAGDVSTSTPAQAATGQQNTGFGTPITITNAQQVAQTAGGDITNAATSLGKTVTGSEAAAASTATSLTTSWLGAIGSWFTQSGFLLAGLILLAFALAFLLREKAVPGLKAA